MIKAIVFLCYAIGGCQSHTVRVEPAACHAPVYRVLMPQDGAWVPARVGIRCDGRQK